MMPSGPHKMYAPPEIPEGDSGSWMVTWADAITVLLGFFVLLFSLSKIDQAKVTALQQALGSETRIELALPTEVAETRTGPELAQRLKELLAPPRFRGTARVRELPAGVAVEFASEELFGEDGSLRPDITESLATFAWEVKGPDMVDYMVEVQALDDWQDSRARAQAFAAFLSAQGVPDGRLRSTSFGSLAPHQRDDRGGALGAAPGPVVRVLLERP